MLDWNLEETWRSAYAVTGYKLGYCRYGMMPYAKVSAKGVSETLELQGAESIILLGAGFGWTAEELLKLHPALNIVCVDNSVWIQTNKDLPQTSMYLEGLSNANIPPDSKEGKRVLAEMDDGGPAARLSILNEDLATAASRNRVLVALGTSKADWVISELVMDACTDADCRKIAANMNQVADRCAHYIVNSEGLYTHDSGYNFKSRAAWKGFIVSQGHQEHLIIDVNHWKVA